MTDDELRLLNELFELGLVSAQWIGSVGNEVHVFPPVSDSSYERGFQTLLRHAIAANAAKLGEARPRETHLVVIVDRSDLSAEPSLTPPLRLPEEIDTLWVLLGYFNAKYTYRLWRTGAESQQWDLLMHPLGEPRGAYPQTLDGMAR